MDDAHLHGRMLSARQAALLERFDALTPSQQVEVMESLERTRLRNQELFESLQQRPAAPPDAQA
ncbi:MAG: hypothetical protein KGJ64_03665 [Betaproteobacteria bacterium]|nr:hypothetical protein [Betaproteobacteria bacterium]